MIPTVLRYVFTTGKIAQTLRLADITVWAICLSLGALRLRRRQQALVDLFGVDAAWGYAVHRHTIAADQTGKLFHPNVYRAVGQHGGIHAKRFVGPSNIDNAAEFT